MPGIPLAPARRGRLLSFVRGSPICTGCCSRIIVLLRAKLHVSRLYNLAPTSLGFRGHFMGMSRRLLEDARSNCCVRTPGARDKFHRIPVDTTTCRTFRHILGGHESNEYVRISNCGSFLFLGQSNLPGATIGCSTVFGYLTGGCGGYRGRPLPSIVAPRAVQRAFYAEVTGTNVGPGTLRCVVKRTGVMVALGCCTRTAFRSTRRRVRQLRTGTGAATRTGPRPTTRDTRRAGTTWMMHEVCCYFCCF